MTFLMPVVKTPITGVKHGICDMGQAYSNLKQLETSEKGMIINNKITGINVNGRKTFFFRPYSIPKTFQNTYFFTYPFA